MLDGILKFSSNSTFTVNLSYNAIKKPFSQKRSLNTPKIKSFLSLRLSQHETETSIMQWLEFRQVTIS